MNNLLTALDRLGSPRLLVVGDLILDRYTWGNAERVSPEAPVLVLHADEDEVRPGGAASVAALLRALDADVVLAGVVGSDPAGVTLRRILDDAGVDCSAILTVPDRVTTSKERYMGRAAQRHPQQILRVDREQRSALSRGAEDELIPLVLRQIPGVKAVLISDYAKGVRTARLLAAVIAEATRLQVPVFVDPGRIADYGKYAGATVAIPNRAEAELAAGCMIRTPQDAVHAGELLCRRTAAQAVLVKLDADGMVLVLSDGVSHHFQTRSRTVYDVTGAGDMVLAMTSLCRVVGLDWEDTISLANIAAGLEVEKLGVAPVTRAEIRAECFRGSAPGKLVTLDEMVLLADGYRRQNKTLVFTNGCFDLLHVGHSGHLQEAARLGDILIVAVNSDASVSRLKGPDRPVVREADRAALLSALTCVNHVLIFDEDTPLELLRRLRPNVLVKGGTYATDDIVGKELVEAYGGQVAVTGKFKGVSTTEILATVRKNQTQTVPMG